MADSASMVTPGSFPGVKRPRPVRIVARSQKKVVEGGHGEVSTPIGKTGTGHCDRGAVGAYDSRVVDHASPSPVIEMFTREVRETFPDTQIVKLASYQERIGKTTDRHDGHRALRCAEWAIKVAADRDLPHPEWRRIKELHAVWRDITWGAGYAAITEDVGRPAPLQDIEIEWIEDAAQVARAIGEADGWEHAPWEGLLSELIEMEPGSG